MKVERHRTIIEQKLYTSAYTGKYNNINNIYIIYIYMYYLYSNTHIFYIKNIWWVYIYIYIHSRTWTNRTNGVRHQFY